ncbi:hypothetical protein MUN89_17245 [Halobacillus salinarum]|uniref:Uncharacterized protein n=1 Tax=Halobacillus salinarum TaxID=2932257 RepID=A0ABY4EHT6_9BACI|nr:hypothetical protein [Halobacillus salinarum]UOQ43632.1 hypothetical protein MUN89_17245 [Halobacillus salinarum]
MANSHVYIYNGATQTNSDGTHLIDGQVVYQFSSNSYGYDNFGYWDRGQWTEFALKDSNPNGIYLSSGGGSGWLYSITVMNYKVWGNHWRCSRSGGAYYDLRGGATLSDGYGNYQYLGASDQIIFGREGSYNQGNTLGDQYEWVQCYGYYDENKNYTDLDYWYINIDDQNYGVSSYSVNTY